MRLGIINEILRGVWLLEPTMQEAYAKMAFQYLDTVAVSPRVEASEVYSNPIVAVGVRTASVYRMKDNTPSEPFVGVIPIDGVVSKSSYCGDMGTVDMMNLMKANEADPSCVGHILKIDSPGGSAANTETFARFIREDCKKPVVAHFNSMCASAAYYIACAADEIYASQSDDSVGSIGVYATLRDYAKAYEKNGIVEHQVYSSLSPQKNDFVKEAFKGNYKPMQKDYLDPVAESFRQTVNDMRPNLTDKSALEGKLFAAKNAPVGMIDGVMKWAAAVARVAQLANANAN